MPRKPRELTDQGIYHLFNRGNNRKDLFCEENDFQVFLYELSRAKNKFSCSIYHYCLMTDHYHLLVRISKGEDLPRFMHQVQLAYARHFKKKYEFLGHVFQERFRSPRIAEESYYLQCGRYIERNPVKAGIARHPWEYPYSSAGYYALGLPDPLVTPNLYYKSMGNFEDERRKSYREFLSMAEPYDAMVDKVLVQV